MKWDTTKLLKTLLSSKGKKKYISVKTQEWELKICFVYAVEILFILCFKKLHIISITKKVICCYFRCTYEGECKGSWWEKTRKRPECLTRNFTGVADNTIICNYCCVSDSSGPCNIATVPEQIALSIRATTTSNICHCSSIILTSSEKVWFQYLSLLYALFIYVNC